MNELSPIPITQYQQRQSGWRGEVFSAESLQSMRFPEIAYVIPGLIAEGLSIIAGRPKVGKSWLALDLASAVAGGGECLGGKHPAQGDVLYAALEDNPRRLQKRMDKLLSTFGDTWPVRLHLATRWRRLDQGGVLDIEEWADSVQEPKLVILDTLAGVRPDTQNKGYSDDYKTLTDLHRLANDRGFAIVVLHHTRKMEADDPIDTVSGTLGLTGCADTVIVIARSNKGTTLYVRGRDVEESELGINFDKASCRWSILGDAADVQRSEQRRAIMEAVRNGDPDGIGPKEIHEACGVPLDSVKHLCGRMVSSGELNKAARGKYVAAE